MVVVGVGWRWEMEMEMEVNVRVTCAESSGTGVRSCTGYSCVHTRVHTSGEYLSSRVVVVVFWCVNVNVKCMCGWSV